MKHSTSSLFLFGTLLAIALPLYAENLWDVVADAERLIQKKYSDSSIAQSMALEELKRIASSDKTDEQKIEEIRQKYPDYSDSLIQSANQPIDYSQLIFRTPLQWTIHSIEIAYDVDSSTTILLSSETVRQEEDNKKRDDSSGLSSTNTDNSKKNNQFGFNVGAEVHIPSSEPSKEKGLFGNLIDWFQAKIGFQWVNDHQSIAQESNTKSSQWDESAQRAWRNLFEEKTQVFKNTKVSNCHLEFSITFQNNTDSDMSFDPNDVRIPVYAGNKHIENARPVDPPSSISIYANATAVQKFRTNLDTTSALQLIDYMRNAAPRISLESGQILISSNDGRIKNAVQESLQNRTVPFRCRDLDLELQILKYHKVNGKQTTVGDAMLAVNSIFVKRPFGIEDGVNTSFAGHQLNDPNKNIDLRHLPVLVINGIPTSSVISADKLNQPITDDGISVQLVNLLDDNEVWKNSSDRMVNHFVTYMKVVAESGGAEVALRLGNLYSLGIGVKQNDIESVKWFKKAAELGNADGQLIVAHSYFNGIGYNQDKGEAFKWYKKAAEQDNAYAEFWVGKCYDNGWGCELDKDKAINSIKKAAEQGVAEAQYELGNHFYVGSGVKQDYVEAATLYQKSADQGFANAQCALGDCYYRGAGREQNYISAIEWYSKAAEQGHVIAQNSLNNLLMLYQNGNPSSVQRDGSNGDLQNRPLPTSQTSRANINTISQIKEKFPNEYNAAQRIRNSNPATYRGILYELQNRLNAM